MLDVFRVFLVSVSLCTQAHAEISISTVRPSSPGTPQFWIDVSGVTDLVIPLPADGNGAFKLGQGVGSSFRLGAPPGPSRPSLVPRDTVTFPFAFTPSSSVPIPRPNYKDVGPPAPGSAFGEPAFRAGVRSAQPDLPRRLTSYSVDPTNNDPFTAACITQHYGDCGDPRATSGAGKCMDDDALVLSYITNRDGEPTQEECQDMISRRNVYCNDACKEKYAGVVPAVAYRGYCQEEDADPCGKTARCVCEPER